MTHPIHLASRPYLDRTWRYGHINRVAYAWPKGVRATAVAAVEADKEIDCTTMSASVLMRAYPAAPWDQDAYDGLHIARRPIVPDDPIRAVVAVGVGVRVEAFVAEAFHLVQGVRSLAPFDGHAFIVWDRGNGILDVLESTSKEGKRGPRWRTTTAKDLHAGDSKGGQFPHSLLIARLL